MWWFVFILNSFYFLKFVTIAFLCDLLFIMQCALEMLTIKVNINKLKIQNK